jgi:hypothetical protein
MSKLNLTRQYTAAYRDTDDATTDRDKRIDQLLAEMHLAHEVDVDAIAARVYGLEPTQAGVQGAEINRLSLERMLDAMRRFAISDTLGRQTLRTLIVCLPVASILLVGYLWAVTQPDTISSFYESKVFAYSLGVMALGFLGSWTLNLILSDSLKSIFSRRASGLDFAAAMGLATCSLALVAIVYQSGRSTDAITDNRLFKNALIDLYLANSRSASAGICESFQNGRSAGEVTVQTFDCGNTAPYKALAFDEGASSKWEATVGQSVAELRWVPKPTFARRIIGGSESPYTWSILAGTAISVQGDKIAVKGNDGLVRTFTFKSEKGVEAGSTVLVETAGGIPEPTGSITSSVKSISSPAPRR